MDKYFLAANSKDGFFSKFDELTSYNEIENFYIIKAGPGCGKSTFMKRLGNYLLDNGYDAEFIYCSSDANSLDGVISSKAKLAICDGTAPHVTEPKYPGAFENYINFAKFLDEEKLHKNVSEVRLLTDTISNHYTTVYKYLECAGILSSELLSTVLTTELIKSIKKRAKGVAHREIKALKDEVGKVYSRFVSGISPQGVYNFVDDLLQKADKVYKINDEFGTSHFFMTEILESAKNAGYTVYKFLCPLNPHKVEHIYIKELKLAFVTDNLQIKIDKEVFRNINLDNYIDKDVYFENKNAIKFLQKQIFDNVNMAINTMKICKKLHDDLEEIYIDAMDFDKLNTIFDEIIAKIK